jgi:uncharacterized protein
MKFEWDEKKNQTNYTKHGLSFEDASLIFEGKTVSFQDNRENYGENRFITLGELKGRVIVVIHTQRNVVTRIISMRKANEREKKIYFERLKETR